MYYPLLHIPYEGSTIRIPADEEIEEHSYHGGYIYLSHSLSLNLSDSSVLGLNTTLNVSSSDSMSWARWPEYVRQDISVGSVDLEAFLFPSTFSSLLPDPSWEASFFSFFFFEVPKKVKIQILL